MTTGRINQVCNITAASSGRLQQRVSIQHSTNKGNAKLKRQVTEHFRSAQAAALSSVLIEHFMVWKPEPLAMHFQVTPRRRGAAKSEDWAHEHTAARNSARHVAQQHH